MKKSLIENWYLYLLMSVGIVLILIAAIILIADNKDTTFNATNGENNEIVAENLTIEAINTVSDTTTYSTQTSLAETTQSPNIIGDTKTIFLKYGESIEVGIDVLYCGSVKSDVFHKIDCDHVSDIAKSNFVTYDSIEDALQKGKRPCKACNP